MVWKQDLAKLKQQLEEGPKAPPPKPAPRPVEKPKAPADLDSEDALFLAAMGRRPARPEPPPAPASGPAPAAPPAPAPETFEDALSDLKGLKPLARPAVLQTPPPTRPLAPEPAPPAAPADRVEEPASPPAPVPAPFLPPAEPAAAPHPVRFQLAAGMALEVDGMLDLRGHCRTDAIERLKDRLADGLLLGWRTLQVILGSDPQLHEGLLALLESGEAPMVVRYAQAPVPMGGSQAGLLYFAPPA